MNTIIPNVLLVGLALVFSGWTTDRNLVRSAFCSTQEGEIEMPTGFSPNGDGANDTFVIHGIEAYPRNTLTVVNRWGNVVYDTFNYTNNWAGDNMQGQALPDGTYFVRFAVNGGERTWKGYVEITR
ncbi:MAG: gliding motility-associated C-terminal domain-containing protein [Flavobacteriales bacterium]|nr:gliding motility-associated C-terminal domain-containing protein [Flavobacteriales bacterium]